MLRALLILLALAVVAAGGLVAWASRHPAIDPIAPPAAASFDAKLVEKGGLLAAMGYCAVCHTRQGGEALAGGLPLPTPFGVIFSTNITPDAETGIGAWSEAAFQRAMSEGIDRRGRHLYPAFPYDHFTRVTAEDVRAIYAYLMTRKPVRSTAPDNQLRFPFNIRLLVAGWNLLFLERGPLAPDPNRDAAWNRGAYLAEGLGHCGSCHTPRNAFGALRSDRKFAGGDIDGWHGTALNSQSPAPVPWTAEALFNYLAKGWDANHGIAAGPMTPVVDLLGEQSDEDLDAIAAYILSFQDRKGVSAEAAIAFARERQVSNAPGAPPPEAEPAMQAGRAIFMQSCVNCHREGQPAAPLALTSTVNGPDPRNALRIIQNGVRPARGARDHAMPAFAWISDQDMASLIAFLRARFSRNPAWPNVAEAIREVRAAPRH